MISLKNFINLEKYTKYSAIVIILFSLVVISLASIHHISGDGCWHIQAGKFFGERGYLPLKENIGRDWPFSNPPVYHIIVGYLYAALNMISHDAANFAVKLVSPFFGILALIVSFLLIRKLYNPKTAFYSILFLASIPIFIDYSVLGYIESSLIFFVFLSIYFLVNERIYLSGIAAGIAMLAKYNGMFVLPILIFILYKKHNLTKNFYKKSIIVIILGLIFYISIQATLKNRT